ncbi:serine hydrolase [Levilactobacillus angrenensis]|uniref:Serine hydrolase n=1 Tax=Levilactobacillus angrenensis TaxID=2486020 RepID=A0ABW1UCE0_9LACO|nr:serine hydrolase [Levilactobacillus angrenensis]
MSSLKRFGLLCVLIGGLIGGWPAVTAQAQSTAHPAAIKRLAKRDFHAVHGRWSVKVTRLGKHPVNVTTGNRHVQAQRSASTIKVYVMLTVFQRAQAHHLKLTRTVKGNLKRMIYYSDNTATNALIRQLGGFKRVNQTAKRFGFKQTHLRRYMLDTAALRRGHDNYTSVHDLTRFLTRTYQHRLLGKTYDRKMLALLHHCRNHSKLPKLVTHAKIYNKTGEFPLKGVQNDAALFKTKRGVYTIVVMAQQGQQFAQYQAMNRLGRDTVRYLNAHAE